MSTDMDPTAARGVYEDTALLLSLPTEPGALLLYAVALKKRVWELERLLVDLKVAMAHSPDAPFLNMMINAFLPSAQEATDAQ